MQVKPAEGLDMESLNPSDHFKKYSQEISRLLAVMDWSVAEQLALELLQCWKTGRQVFLAGNGGSAGNANHIENDFLYPISKKIGSGIRMNSLSSNPAVLSCLANDLGYDQIYSCQLAVQARAGDMLIVFSGSGNSANILNALEEARRQGLKSYAVVGFDGGKAKSLADMCVHFPVHDMQIAEDTQVILFHMIVQWLYAQRETVHISS